MMMLTLCSDSGNSRKPRSRTSGAFHHRRSRVHHYSRNKKRRDARALASRPIIGNILLERFQFAAEVVDTPLQQVADGENAEQPTVIVGYGQMTEMALQHGGERLAR